MKAFLIVLFWGTSTLLLSQNINLSNEVVFDGEPYVAINPLNSQHIVVAWMGWVDINNRFQIKTRTSFDGGLTWSSTYEIPHTAPSYSSADPCLDFNSSGEVYVSFIDFTGTTPPVTGGVYLCKSTDGGLSWGTAREVISTNFDTPKWPIDRPWLAIDKSLGATDGNIYVTSFNLNRNTPPFNPYLSISTDDGASFTSRYVDTTDWLAGSINPLPFCYPTINSNGTLFASYPSFVVAQSFYSQVFLGVSNDSGNSVQHKLIATINPPAGIENFPDAKKGSPILSDPSNPDHLVYLFLSAETGDLDVYMMESYDAGDSWTAKVRLNDDPLMNNRMQDLIWGDFDDDGDLIVSWRDRRNGGSGTYQAESEIWATFRDKDSSTFGPNFRISDQLLPHNSDLEEAGNDFMCIKLKDDTLSAVWGDPRDGEINIWFQRLHIDGSVLSTTQIAAEKVPSIQITPNPAGNQISVSGQPIESIKVLDSRGRILLSKTYSDQSPEATLDIQNLKQGSYIVKVESQFGIFTATFVKK
jgi:hypothetical protein